MATRCVYCKSEIHDNRSMEICDRCGRGVWGEKMFATIKASTDEARDRGDLCRTNMNPEEVEIKFIDTNGFAVNAIQDVIVQTK